MRMDSARRRLAALAVATAAVIVVAQTSSAGAAPGTEGQKPSESRSGTFASHQHGKSDKDLPGAHKAPSAKARSAADKARARVSWSRYGTPTTVVPDGDGAALAKGLPTKPEQTARAYLKANADLFGISADQVDGLKLMSSTPIGKGAAVLLAQEVDGKPFGQDGQVSVGVVDGTVVSVSGALAPVTGTPKPATLSAQDAIKAALADVTMTPGKLTSADAADGWQKYDAAGLTGSQLVRAVVVADPDGTVRSAYQVQVGTADEDPQLYDSIVDARTGEVLSRRSLVDDEVAADHDGNPQWKAFSFSPPLDDSSKDTRQTVCWVAGPGCDQVLSDSAPAAPHHAWDIASGEGGGSYGSFYKLGTTLGANAFSSDGLNSTGRNWLGITPDVRPDRVYDYTFADAWHASRCDPKVLTDPSQPDRDAALGNLFVQHNIMHDFSYQLGFTEKTWNMQSDNYGLGGKGGDPEMGVARSGGNNPATRNNANQSTGADGGVALTNMYLWQPQAGAFYGRCADGDFDNSVIGHEYTHAISNRMVGGGTTGLSGAHAGSMGESWSDLVSTERLIETGAVPDGVDPWVVGPYVTDNNERGIRNFAIDNSPLNYSNFSYDMAGAEVHSDGEIWNAVNYEVRQALIGKYGEPSQKVLASCAAGKTSVDKCGGGRRWIQLMFDSYLLMGTGKVTMVDARDAMLAADKIRYHGDDLDVMWGAFSKRGLGTDATATSTSDTRPHADFATPADANGNITFKIVNGGDDVPNAQIFIGQFSARTTPIAGTTAGLSNKAAFAKGHYTAIAVAPGYGEVPFDFEVTDSSKQTVKVKMQPNLASAAAGATITGGDGMNLSALIDDDEGTNWAFVGEQTKTSVSGKGVLIHLARDSASKIRRVQVSALNRPTNAKDPGGDTGSQSRFSALRQFEVSACTRTATVDCSQAKQFHVVYLSPKDAFQAAKPRPLAPNLTMRSFDIPVTTATDLRFEAITNQCVGNPAYAGKQDNDPNNVTDCATGSPSAFNVRASEFQVFEK
ncbi:M36 family metallopeptidase [Streptomyces brevispora]|uniref:M36 family metallopeptidase n=1 Tax=Streptomyces brevispora TaxID=887462 RepID=A0A561V3E6_9ACTN|nr:M36 family metallopeptidase [Streptomyces brevispora]TWG06135.1 peptidase YpeB-like protein [Streptomyces brevispora]WSC12899.1 M36 family metallopeptidase [Streptomyces brevispora]